jgi:hypothetical protein
VAARAASLPTRAALLHISAWVHVIASGCPSVPCSGCVPALLSRGNAVTRGATPATRTTRLHLLWAPEHGAQTRADVTRAKHTPPLAMYCGSGECFSHLQVCHGDQREGSCDEAAQRRDTERRDCWACCMPPGLILLPPVITPITNACYCCPWTSVFFSLRDPACCMGVALPQIPCPFCSSRYVRTHFLSVL